VYVFFGSLRVFNNGGSRRFVPMAMMAIAYLRGDAAGV